MSERVLYEWTTDSGRRLSILDESDVFGKGEVGIGVDGEIDSSLGWGLALARELARLAARVRELEGANAKLRAALLPFSDDELCRELGGNVEGDESPVFQRGSMKEPLRLKHFRAARAEVDK